MEKNSHFSAPRRRVKSPARRSSPSSKALADAALLAHGPAMRLVLQNLPDSRPEAVALARKLIADPEYPTRGAQETLARYLALHLTAEIDSLPT